MTDRVRKRIVAEVSATLAIGAPPATPLSIQFEDVVSVNGGRGYELESWQFQSCRIDNRHLVETIIAVFVEATT